MPNNISDFCELEEVKLLSVYSTFDDNNTDQNYSPSSSVSTDEFNQENLSTKNRKLKK